MPIDVGGQGVDQVVAVQNKITHTKQLQVVRSHCARRGSGHALTTHIKRQRAADIAIGLLFDGQRGIDGNGGASRCRWCAHQQRQVIPERSGVGNGHAPGGVAPTYCEIVKTGGGVGDQGGLCTGKDDFEC